jgi:HAD superfamily 5'-nucleotidase-like hydrolase
VHVIKKRNIIKAYAKYKRLCGTFETKNELHKNPLGVFCNNEINLKDIQVYGFDYDYTLAYYNDSLYNLIFDLARESLIIKQKYPEALRQHCEYLPEFPIRGLHMDKKRGWLMKVDSYHNIQLGTVFNGMYAVSNEEVIKSYGGTLRLNIEDIGYAQSSSTFHHFVDLFCLPEICLIACVIQFFIDRKINFTPEYLFADVKEAVESIHRNQLLHKSIAQNIDDYLLPVQKNNSPSGSSVHIKGIYSIEFIYDSFNYNLVAWKFR